ncbi:nuclear transport factor 2 family protein [Kitasatospora sp. NPDC085879]|uniref:nuclear transport factor 2 family protein n=1 Tax=Kitasatospora sp. NPDC085879 TaxID=3154769 RepID=UPI00344756E1
MARIGCYSSGEACAAHAPSFLDHITHLRDNVTGGHVEVHEELHDGTKYADRHTAHITKNDGTTATMEVYVFADLAPDGRFHRIEETTLLLERTDTDRTIGSAR